MDNESLKEWGKILGSLVTLMIGIRWLLSVYFTQSEKLEKLKDTMFNQRLEKLETAFNGFTEKLEDFGKKMLSYDHRIGQVVGTFEENQKAAKRVYEELKGFIASVNARFKEVEYKIGRVIKRD